MANQVREVVSRLLAIGKTHVSRYGNGWTRRVTHSLESESMAADMGKEMSSPGTDSP